MLCELYNVVKVSWYSIEVEIEWCDDLLICYFCCLLILLVYKEKVGQFVLLLNDVIVIKKYVVEFLVVNCYLEDVVVE